MPDADPKLEADRRLLAEAQAQGGTAKLRAYVKLSGPGWLQSALTLGGGSLASSLYLGVLAGVAMMWLQPLAMILGIVMLSAIGYVTLSTGERPLRAINKHVNPVLGWAWVAATMAANMVWALPQYSLSYGVLEQNLIPNVLGEGGPLAGEPGKWVVSAVLLTFATLVTWSYGRGHLGVKIYERALKIVVAIIVLCFIGVVVKMSFIPDAISWKAVWGGFVPNLNQLFEPAAAFQPFLSAISDNAAQAFWTDYIVHEQRAVMISAAATAVGINMTFLLPYSLLARGWTKEFRGPAIFDLSTGMLIPFVLATSCVIIASATQFHAKMPDAFHVDAQKVVPSAEAKKLGEKFHGLLKRREDALAVPASLIEQKLAATLVRRDAMQMATSLEPLTGRTVGNFVFGIGVVAMTLSTISLLMLISGLVACEVVGVPPTGWTYRLGCLAAASGALWPLLWADDEARLWLAIVASLFGATLLPIAYFTFFLLMNQKSLLKENLPRGARRLVWNVVMAIAATAAAVASVYVIWSQSQSKLGSGWIGISAVVAFLTLVLVVQFTRTAPNKS